MLLAKLLVADFLPNPHCSYHLAHILLLWVLVAHLLVLRHGQAAVIPFCLTLGPRVAVMVVGLQVSLHGEVEMLVVQAVDRVRAAVVHQMELQLKVLAVVRPQMMVLAVAVVLVVLVLTVQLLMEVPVVLV
jgi:hypothetical protein